MKGQSSVLGGKFQVYEDVCISYEGMSLGTGRTFDIGDSSSRKTQNPRSSLQVMLIHE